MCLGASGGSDSSIDALATHTLTWGMLFHHRRAKLLYCKAFQTESPNLSTPGEVVEEEGKAAASRFPLQSTRLPTGDQSFGTSRGRQVVFANPKLGSCAPITMTSTLPLLFSTIEVTAQAFYRTSVTYAIVNLKPIVPGRK